MPLSLNIFFLIFIILVIKNQEVSVIPLQGRGSLEKLFEMAPEIISKFNPGGAEEVKEKEKPEE